MPPKRCAVSSALSARLIGGTAPLAFQWFKDANLLADATNVIAEGEVMQLAAAKNTATTEDEYLAVIRAKTAALFAAASEVGPVLANRPKGEAAACRSYGANLGVAFQLIDDALDYGGTSAKLGKNTGDDFREGKITLPVVLSFRRGGAEEREFWKRTLEKGEIGDNDLQTALGIMRSFASAIRCPTNFAVGKGGQVVLVVGHEHHQLVRPGGGKRCRGPWRGGGPGREHGGAEADRGCRAGAAVERCWHQSSFTRWRIAGRRRRERCRSRSAGC